MVCHLNTAASELRLSPSSARSAVGHALSLSHGAALPGTQHEAAATAIAIYRNAIATVFMMGVCVVALVFVAILFMPELPLSSQRDLPPTKR
ncbi:MAG TPA: hypothetical protein VHX12_12550 [Acidisoma sp.]|jgi:hypothetical protein|nr:hypothetical protein [Acidisoma sp.]